VSKNKRDPWDEEPSEEDLEEWRRTYGHGSRSCTSHLASAGSGSANKRDLPPTEGCKDTERLSCYEDFIQRWSAAREQLAALADEFAAIGNAPTALILYAVCTALCGPTPAIMLEIRDAILPVLRRWADEAEAQTFMRSGGDE